jgi:iron complex transport system ATP-binding protein
MKTDVVLEACDISVRLGGRVVLENIRLAIHPGTVTGLIGPNGAGKSTLMRALVRILEPDTGSARLGGADVRKLAPRSFAQTVAYVPQEAVCHWPIPGMRIVELGRHPHGGRGEASDARAVEAAMQAMEVSHLAERPANALSGGELRRLLLARALATEPRFLLLDEPTSGLDPYHQIHLSELLRRVAGQGCGVLTTLHDLTLAARTCDRLVLLHNGRVAADGTPAEVLSPDNLRKCYDLEAYLEVVAGVPVLVPRGRDGISAR